MLNWIENVEFIFYNFVMSMNQLSGFYIFKMKWIYVYYASS